MPSYMFAYLPTHLGTYLSSYQPIYLPTYLPTYLHILGLSGECIEEQGHYWVGMDIAPAMLNIAKVYFFTFSIPT